WLRAGLQQLPARQAVVLEEQGDPPEPGPDEIGRDMRARALDVPGDGIDGERLVAHSRLMISVLMSLMSISLPVVLSPMNVPPASRMRVSFAICSVLLAVMLVVSTDRTTLPSLMTT